MANIELAAKCATKELADQHIEQENQSLQQKLQELDQQHSHLKCLYDMVTQQLSQLSKYLGEVDEMKKQVDVMTKAISAKTAETLDLKEEKESLRKILEDVADELQRQKLEVCVLCGVTVNSTSPVPNGRYTGGGGEGVEEFVQTPLFARILFKTL